MNIVEKTEKALELLKNLEGTNKIHEIQATAGSLGRCLGAIGCRQNFSRHYANLLSSGFAILLGLASHDSAEIRLVGDEALNRVIVGGTAYHSHKTNIVLQNYIEPGKNARWIRAALSRICLGDTWLRPGVGRIRTQAQTLFPKLSQIVKQTSEIQLIVAALESNLPRILNALVEYATDEEVYELCKSLLSHVETSEPAVRRGISFCVAHLCSHREKLLNYILEQVFEKLWPTSPDNNTILGWFCVVKAVFQINSITKFSENDLFEVDDYLEIHQLCIHYIEHCNTDHNIQNVVMECMCTMLSQAQGAFRKSLLEPHPKVVSLANRPKRHKRNFSWTSAPEALFVPSPLEHRDPLDTFSDSLRTSSLMLNTPSMSVDDLTLHTPETPSSDVDIQLPDSEQLSKDLTEKLQEIEDTEQRDRDYVEQAQVESGLKVNIGASNDDDILLKYCSRLLASKFLLTGNKGDIISDRSVRVSVKSSALNCLSEILLLYPQVMTMYLDKDADVRTHNASGSTDNTDSNLDNINDFILERNVCYQDSLSESLAQDLFNKSLDFDTQLLKHDTKSIEKSVDSDQKSTKDIPSNILDKCSKNDLIASALTDSTNPNMTNSNFTINSNLSSNDPTTNYPMTSSGDILSSSIDLDMRFDHFGDSMTAIERVKIEKRVDPVPERDEIDGVLKEVKEFQYQHMCDIFVLFESHSDPQIRGLIRLCIGNYLSAALDLSHGDYGRWKNFSVLCKEISDSLTTERLVQIVLKGLSDEIHSTVNHTLSALTNMSVSLTHSAHWPLLEDMLNALMQVENNKYWLCRVNLCKLYEKLPYKRLFMLLSSYKSRSRIIMDTLIRLLADQDQKVRKAAAETIANITPIIYPSTRHTATSMMTEIARDEGENFNFNQKGLTLELVRHIYFHYDLPEQMKCGKKLRSCDGLRMVVGDLMGKLMASSCKYLTQGLLETLQSVCNRWSPWKHIDAYSDQGILSYCLDNLDYYNGNVASRTILMDLCYLIYPVDIHNIMRIKSNQNIFEPDTQTSRERWQHLESETVSKLGEKFLQVTLKMLNVLVHLIEEVNPNVHLNKSGIVLPGSPVRRKTQDSMSKKNNPLEDEKNTLKKKAPIPATSLKANFTGHFYNEPFYMKFYDNLRATYNNFKINLDPKSSIFHEFLTTVLNCLVIQLELATEKEIGCYTEEILYYIKVIMPVCQDKIVNCVTQLLKCLFGTNMINQYSDFMSIMDKEKRFEKMKFFEDVLLVNENLEVDRNKDRMEEERQLLIAMETFAKNRFDRKFSTNKEVLERYIKLFEPVVIQALKSYTMQKNIPLQREVLSLLRQLLASHVNYCVLDRDQIFIAFLMKQLELAEQHEIPDCCELVNSILMFLVTLSASKHHTKVIIEIPKLIQLCDGLMASGAHAECIAGLEPVAVKVFSSMGGQSVLGRAQHQEVQATREVLFYMLQKSMHQDRVLDLISSVLLLSQEQPESYYRWSELASDTLLNLLAQNSLDIDTVEAVMSLERLLQSIYSEVLMEQSRLEIVMKILFRTAVDQATTPFKQKLRYLIVIMVLLRNVIVHVPESEILLTIDYLKSTFISPQSIFFNAKVDIDPLNVQNVNENCANLSPDVVLARFLFKTLTFVITETDSCHEASCSNFNSNAEGDKGHGLLYAVCVNLVVQVKNMLHLTDGCQFPLTAKTAQNLLHNEQSGLNTGLYSPQENIPLDLLNLICLRSSSRMPLLTVHWTHLLIRLNFISHKYNNRLPALTDNCLAQRDIVQCSFVLAFCEYFVENGLSQAVELTWLIVNHIQVLITLYNESIVQKAIAMVQSSGTASALSLQAIAARCQTCLKGEFALNTYKILSQCHDSQSGALVFLICRILAKLEPAMAVRFSKLAVERCKKLKEMDAEQIHEQLSKEDVQVALELLQRDKVHLRYSLLVKELNSLASSVFDLTPLDLSQDRHVNPKYIHTINVDSKWLVHQVKTRCCKTICPTPKVPNHVELSQVMLKLSTEDLTTVMTCPEFDRTILSTCFKVACDAFSKQFLDVTSVVETKEIEKELIKEQRDRRRQQDEIIVENNKLNPIHVFKKGDNRESKSQFFIPITENTQLDNIEISDEEIEILPPELSDLYKTSLTILDRSIADILKLFPKQSRPLSQSENFDLNLEQTIDKYTRRCHQVFQDKLFYQEFMTLQTILTGYLESLHAIITLIDNADCDILDKFIHNILPNSLAKNIAIFAVISLQYLSFLIKNKYLVTTPVHADVSFRLTVSMTDNVVVENVVLLTAVNVAKALELKEIWTELNSDSNVNRTQSAISCLYAVIKYLVKDTKPIILKHYLQTNNAKQPKSDFFIIGNKLVTLIEYWEHNFYINNNNVLDIFYRKPLERILVSLSRLDIVGNIALIPPIAWSSVELIDNESPSVDLPLQPLQDLDVLEAFLFRVNFISWSSKKQFEEIWVALLNALQGNGTSLCVKGIGALVITAAAYRGRLLHVCREQRGSSFGMQRLRKIVVGTKAYDLFENINLERIPLKLDGLHSYHYAQFNTEYLKYASELSEDASYKIRREVKHAKKNQEIDINSCLQLLMDIISQMLDPKADTGIAARVSLINLITQCTTIYSTVAHWCWAGGQLVSLSQQANQYTPARRALLHALSVCLCVLDSVEGLQELSTVHQKLLKSLSSSYAPLRQAALHGCLLQLSNKTQNALSQTIATTHCKELVAHMNNVTAQYLSGNSRISLYEQSLYWTVLFSLVELGHSDLINIAVDFIINNPRHYCTGLVVKGITLTIRRQVLPKEVKKIVIEKLLEDKQYNYTEDHAVQILLVHLFSAHNKLLSPKLTKNLSNMDPDILMTSMERITLLYKVLRRCTSKENKLIVTCTLKYFLRETLPPASSLSRAVVEFLDCCKENLLESAICNARVLFEVFEIAVSQDQLPTLSGWIFEALNHLLVGKLSTDLLPYCLLILLFCSSANENVRKLAPLSYHILRLGFQNTAHRGDEWGIYRDYVEEKKNMSFTDRRLMCMLACHSGLSSQQIEKLKDLSSEYEGLVDMTNCLKEL